MSPRRDTDDRDGTPPNLAECAELLRTGGLVAIPTETVYGIGANALDADAVLRIFEAKGRPANIPLIVHIADADQLGTVTAAQPELAQKLAAAFWPGPLTLVLPRGENVPSVVTAGLDTVGVRVPAHPVARAVIAAAGVPVAAPSANPFTQVSPTTADHVRKMLGDRVDAVLDGGAANVGIESTVVDASGDQVVLLRPGGISVAQLEAVAGPVVRAKLADDAVDAPRPSPGTSERHYAPRARLVEVTRDADGHLSLPLSPGEHGPWALVTFGDESAHAPTLHRTMLRDPAGFARDWFATLHDVDAAGCIVAFVERLPTDDAWEAVADRLRRAGLERADDR